RTLLKDQFVMRFVRCERCRTVYLNPRPGAAERASYYERNVRAGDVIRSQLNVAGSRRRAFRLISRVVHRHKQAGDYLDVGCNTGALFGYFDRRAWRCYGIEPDADLANYASATQGAVVHNGTLDDVPPNRFDLVTMIDTI